MFDHGMLKFAELVIWAGHHIYLLLLVPVFIVLAALIDGGDK